MCVRNAGIAGLPVPIASKLAMSEVRNTVLPERDRPVIAALIGRSLIRLSSEAQSCPAVVSTPRKSGLPPLWISPCLPRHRGREKFPAGFFETAPHVGTKRTCCFDLKGLVADAPKHDFRFAQEGSGAAAFRDFIQIECAERVQAPGC